MVRFAYHRLLGLIPLLIVSLSAVAQTDFQGSWSVSPTTIKVSIQSWGPDCGQKPVSEVRSGGGEATITQNGYHLTINTRNGVVRTDSCWTKNPAVRRVSSSYLEGEWTINCKTSIDDPKEEFGEYSMRAQGGDRLEYKEVNRYNWKLNESKCVATVTTTQTFTRLSQSEAQSRTKRQSAKSASITPEVKSTAKCQPAAVAASLIIRPQRSVIAPGQRVCLRAALLDANRCELPNPSIEWSLHHSKALRGELAGSCFQASESAAESEGEYRVIASSGSLSAQALITVQAADLSDLIARQIESGESRGNSEVGNKAPDFQAPSKLATRDARISEKSAQFPLIAIAGVAILAGLVLIIAAITRRGRSLQNAARPPATVQFPKKAPSSWPAKKVEASAAQIEAQVVAGAQWVCPACRRAYPAEIKRCPHDGTDLIEYEQFTKAHKAQHTSVGQKRCPKCGVTYSDTSAFCPQDGVALVPINEGS